MSINKGRATAVIGGILGVLVLVAVLLSLEHKVPKPKDWPANVTLYRKALTGETRVFDDESGKFLFSYRPEYDLNVHPIKIEKLDGTHWQVVLEAPAHK